MNHENASLILLVDSEKRSLEEIRYGLAQPGYEVIAVETGDHALNVLESETVHVLVCELNGPGIDGMRLMDVARRRNPDTGVIMMTVPGTVEMAVTAMREGAYDVLERPVRVEKLAVEIEKILERQSIVRENIDLHRRLESRYGFESIIGKSASMRRIREQIAQIADTQATVLITGESGTGKELAALALHINSNRKEKPFVPVSCSAFSEGVIESELFGHERGAFTGAVNLRKGRFELANGGTLFLDEVGDLTPSIQVKLLRVLQDRKFQRVGGNRTIETDVRLIAATNRNLEEEIARGRYREDLYYRLKVVTITMPPLRERKEDLPLLIEHFIHRFSEREGKPIDRLNPRALEMLSAYHWPGNVRELENCIEGMIVMASDEVLDEDDVPEYIRNVYRGHPAAPALSSPATSGTHTPETLPPDLIRSLIMSVAERRGIELQGISDTALQRLSSIKWNQNGRSLRRCIDMMVLLADHPVLEVEDIPPEFLPSFEIQDANGEARNRVDIRVGMTMKEAERALIQATLKSCDYNKARTARVLHIGLRTLFRKIKEYRIHS